MMVSVPGGLRGTVVLDRFPRLAAYVARGEDRPALADHLAVLEQAVAALSAGPPMTRDR